MVMLPKPPAFTRSSLRHVLWQIEQIDATLTVAGNMLAAAATRELAVKARANVNALLDHRLELMACRDQLQADKAEAAR